MHTKRYPSIGNAFLGYSKVENIEIPEGITELDYMFLYNCIKLKTLELPSTFTKQLRSDFCANCTALESVTYKAAPKCGLR